MIFRNISICTFVFYLGFSSLSLHAQDLIVTKGGDSINCSIAEVRSGSIHFSRNTGNGTLNVVLPLDQVSNYETSYYKRIEARRLRSENNWKYTHWRLSVEGGASCRLGKIPDSYSNDLKRYAGELRYGYHYGGQLTYFFAEEIGAGLKFSEMRVGNSAENFLVTKPNGSTQYGTMKNDITMDFTSAIISARIYDLSMKNNFLISIGLGYISYKDDMILITDYRLKGGSTGLSVDFGYDIAISKKLSFGFQFSSLLGIMKKSVISDGLNIYNISLDKSNYESLSRIDVSVGLRLTL